MESPSHIVGPLLASHVVATFRTEVLVPKLSDDICTEPFGATGRRSCQVDRFLLVTVRSVVVRSEEPFGATIRTTNYSKSFGRGEMKALSPPIPGMVAGRTSGQPGRKTNVFGEGVSCVG